MTRFQRHTEMGGRWRHEPTVQQLHALTGDLVIATRLYGNGLKRRINPRGHLTYQLIPDSYVAFAQEGRRDEISHEILEGISARLGVIARKHWQLTMSERSMRRDITAAPTPVDVFQIENADTGRISGLFEIDPSIEEFGVRTDYRFEWNRTGVVRAERYMRAVPDSREVGGVLSSRTLDEQVRDLEPQGSSDKASWLDTFVYDYDHSHVSGPDVTYLRERIRVHCQHLVSAWQGTKND